MREEVEKRGVGGKWREAVGGWKMTGRVGAVASFYRLRGGGVS